jgi:hypothetical protein
MYTMIEQPDKKNSNKRTIEQQRRPFNSALSVLQGVGGEQ